MRDLRLVTVALVLACSPKVEIEERADRGVAVGFQPPSPPDAISEVLRISVGGRAPEQLVLLSGELSTYHQGRLRRGDLPKTLRQRLVPALTYSAAGRSVLAPTQRLESNGVYTLGALGEGVILGLRVRPTPAPVLERRWPWGAEPTASGLAVYCGPEAVVPADLVAQVRLEPGSVPAEVRPGAGHPSVLGELCVTLRYATQDGVARVPPASVRGLLLDPQPLAQIAPSIPMAQSCPSGWGETALGCYDVQDDRIHYRARYSPAAVAVDSGGLREVVPVDGSGQATLRGFTPGTSSQISLFEVSHGGLESHSIRAVDMLPARPHPLLSEVMANAVGPEPAQEWVELFNDGQAEWYMAGFVLTDAAGSTELPELALGPGQYALIVNDSYDPESFADLAPAPGTVLLRVPKLGKNGLSNAGEPLALLGPNGSVWSTFPALKHSKAGVSAARLVVGTSPDTFGMSAQPGASPGAPNALQPP